MEYRVFIFPIFFFVLLFVIQSHSSSSDWVKKIHFVFGCFVKTSAAHKTPTVGIRAKFTA